MTITSYLMGLSIMLVPMVAALGLAVVLMRFRSGR
jgi:hypothetical protein